MGYSPTEYAEFTEPPAEMSSHGFLLRRVWHLAIPTPLAMGYSPTEYAEFTEPPTETPPTNFSLGGYGRDAIPSYICEHPCHLWEALLCQKFLCVPCVLWESLSSHGFLLRRVWHLAIPTPPAMGYPPTEYAEFTEPPTEMSSHGFHRFTQILRVRCSPTEFTEYTEFVSVGMAGMPYPPTSVLIRAICGRLFSARGSVYSVHSVGASSPLVLLVQQRLLHPLAESTEVVCKSHPFTSNPAFCMSSQYCGYDFVTTCGSLMRSPGNTIAAGANAIAMRWSS